MNILTIDRSKWRRGGLSHNRQQTQGMTALLNDKGFMCCLGFDAIACGIPKEAILGVLEPVGVLEKIKADAHPRYITMKRFDYYQGEPAVWERAEAIAEAMAHNDDDRLGDAEREALIRADLKALGWEDVIFINVYPSDNPAQPTLPFAEGA